MTAAAPSTWPRCARLGGIDVLIAAEQNVGFAANTNRGLRASDAERDVVVLNSDIEALPSWLECLQYAAYRYRGRRHRRRPASVSRRARSIRRHGTQLATRPSGSTTATASEPRGWGPAGRNSAALAVTGACMYVRRELIEQIGLLDESYAMAYEDVDWCLRAWRAGFGVVYFPAAQLIHHESVTRGTELGERERESQRLFWERWSDFFEARSVTAGSNADALDGRLRIVYVTEDTGVGGGHRDIFEHLNRLAARGHEASLYTLGAPPEWFPLDVPVHSFADYDELAHALSEVEAIKVATWWVTAGPVWRASIPRGLPVYFVQDIETSYYPDDERARHSVIDSYRPEFRYMTISSWNRDRLRELGLDAELIPPGIDLENFRPREDVVRREDMVLALGRSNPLKNLPLTLAAWKALKKPRPELCLFGIEPELARGDGVRYVDSPERCAGQRALQPGDRVRPDLQP